MSERLTDEELRERIDRSFNMPWLVGSLDELIRLRAVWKIAQPFLPGPVYVRCLAALSASPAPDPAEATARLERGIRERDTVIANLIAAPAPGPTEAMRAKWPDGCDHPNICSRNGCCMYLGCVHDGKPIAALKGNGEGK